ncbi:MAG: GIY-YIG nuclease family protein [Anaerolineales bacterium]
MSESPGVGYYCYMVECADGSYYTGWTTDPERRVKEHNAGRGALYTKFRRPVELIYLEEVTDRPAAQRRENKIKKLTREKKVNLVREFTENS